MVNLTDRQEVANDQEHVMCLMAGVHKHTLSHWDKRNKVLLPC